MAGVFKSLSKIQRSPPPSTVNSAVSPPSQSESGFVSDFLNVSENLKKLEEKNRVEDVIKSRKSVSFTIPISSSTVYNVDESSDINDLTEDVEKIDSTETVDRLNRETEDLINLIEQGVETINQRPLLDENRISQSNLGFSILDHYQAAELSYSTLKDSTVVNHNESLLNTSVTEADIHTIPKDALPLQPEKVSDNIHSNQQKQTENSLNTVNQKSNLENSSETNSSSGEKPQNSESSSVNRVEITANSVVNRSNFDIIQHEVEEDEMDLKLSDILSGIRDFPQKSGDEVKGFIANCDMYHELASAGLKPTVLTVIRTRLAAIPKLGNVSTLTWPEIKARILNKFKPDMSFEAAQEKLWKIGQNKDESIEKFGERIKHLLEAMNATSLNDNNDIQSANFASNENMAVRKFKQNLRSENLRTILLSHEHNDLYSTIAFAVQKSEELSCCNVKKEEPKKEKEKQKNKLFCTYCKKPNHDIEQCRTKKREQSIGESSQKPESKPFMKKPFDKNKTINQSTVESEGEATSSSQAPDAQIFDNATESRVNLCRIPFSKSLNFYTVDAQPETNPSKHDIPKENHIKINAILTECNLTIKNKDPTITVNVSICDAPITFLVDTGANASMITSKFLKTNVLYYPNVRYCLTGINGPSNPVKTLGAVYANISIANLKLNHQFQIAGQDIHMGHGGILGFDFLLFYHANISLYRATITFFLPPNHVLYEHEERVNFERKNSTGIQKQIDGTMVKYRETNSCTVADVNFMKNTPRENKFINAMDSKIDELKVYKISINKSKQSIEIKPNEIYEFQVYSEKNAICKARYFAEHVFSPNTVIGTGSNSIFMHNQSDKTITLNENDLHVEYDSLDNYHVYAIKENKALSGIDRVEYLKNKLDTAHCSSEELQIIYGLICDYSDIFHIEGDGLSFVNYFEHKINIKPGTKPIFTRQYKIPHAQKEIVATMIKDMLEKDIIEPSTSQWNSPLLLVPKKGSDREELRFCIDFKRVNNVTDDTTFPMPDLDEEIQKMKGAKVFSSLDVYSAFHQMKLRKEDREITAFSTSNQKYQFKRMPFGLKSSPITWQLFIITVLSNLLNKNNMVYMDDILSYSTNIRAHEENLRAVFDRLRKFNIKLKVEKTRLFCRELKYLGHVISEKGVRADEKNVEVIRKFPRPTSLAEVQRFIGMSSYYRKFIKNFAQMAQPLHALCKKNAEFTWSKACETAFENLKSALCNQPVLCFPDFTRTFYISTDASFYAVGAYISNEKPPNDRPIEYFSKSLNTAQINYATTHKELLAIILAIERFAHYIWGKHFVVHTDHEALTYLFNQSKPGSRLLRWKLLLAEYDFDIIHRPGKHNVVSDCLSRIKYAEIHFFSSVTNQATKSILAVTTRSKAKENRLLHTENQQNVRKCYLIHEESGVMFENKKHDKIYFIVDDVNALIFKKLELKLKRKIKLTGDEPYEIYGITDLYDIILLPKYRFDVQKLSNVLAEIRTKAEEHSLLHIACNIGIANPRTYFEIREEYKKMFARCETSTTFYVCSQIEVTDIEHINEILHTYHRSLLGGHCGFERMKNTIRKFFSWPQMSHDIKKYIDDCDICEKTKITRKTHTPLQIASVANAPFEKMYIDFVGEINPNSNEGHKYIMTMSCDLTKFVIAVPTFDSTALTAAKTIVEHVCLLFNIPKIIISDNGPAFIAEIFSQIMKLLNITHIKTAPYHPQSNGGIERYHRTLGQYVRSYAQENPCNWHSFIPYFCFSYNNTMHTATGYSPHMLVFGFEIELPSSVKNSRINYNYDSYKSELLNELKKSQQRAKEMIEKSRQENKKQYENKQKCAKLSLKRNDLVLMSQHKKNGKFDTCYSGPFRVEEIVSPAITKIRKGKNSVIIHNDHLKLSKAKHGKNTPPPLE